MNKIITISREFGSGGRELGMKLAKKLAVPFYDKELISMAAKDSNIEESVLRKYDETAPGFFAYSAVSPFSIYQLPMSDQIYGAQSNILKELADKGPCVIVGRCADSVIKDSIKIFVHADIQNRIQRKLTMDTHVPPEKMESHIREVDKKRKRYYQNYTDKTWGLATNYHLCLDSGPAGIDGCLEAILSYLKNVD